MLKFYQLTHIIFFISTFAASLGDFLHATIAYIHDYSLLSYKANAFMILADTAYFIATIVLYCLLFGRLYFTFNQTQYRLSNSIVIFYIIIITVSSIMFGLYFYYWYDTGFYVELLLIILSLNDLILNITLTVLFITKIKALVVTDHTFNMSNNHQMDKYEDENDEIAVIFNKRQYRLIDMITRYAMLSILIIVVKQEFNLWYLIQLVYLKKTNNHAAIGSSLRGLENVLDVVVLYIGLCFNGKLYDKLCGKCHRFCLRCCTKRIKTQIKRRISTLPYNRMNVNE